MPDQQHNDAAVSRRLAEVVAATRDDDLPPAVVADTLRAVLDWLGSALAGAVEPPARMAQAVVASLGVSDEAAVFGAGRASAPGAALANGVASHILELDDVHKGSTMHPAAPIIPAALAIAERERADGRAFLRAVALGYEAGLRVGEAVNPSHYRFWHPTGTAATFGAAVAAGSLLGLDAAQMLDALGTAGTQAAGLWEFNADGAMSKSLHPGKAAFNGILAADLARLGFTGATRILEGERGFFRATTAAYDAARVTEGLGAQWKISENCYKLYSCCGHTHTAIDSALDLRATQGWQRPAALAQVAAIEIRTYGPGYDIVREMNPRTPYQAKFSLAYVVAAALLEGWVGLAQFDPSRFGPDGVREPAIAALLARTTVTVEPALTAMYPAAWPARLCLRLDDGAVVEAGGDYPRGNPENPVSTHALEDKLAALVTPRLGADVTQRALALVHALPEIKDMRVAVASLMQGVEAKT
ncbi:MAG: MmgE/PrpD family protein [Anaerolineae bacterium]